SWPLRRSFRRARCPPPPPRSPRPNRRNQPNRNQPNRPLPRRGVPPARQPRPAPRGQQGTPPRAGWPSNAPRPPPPPTPPRAPPRSPPRLRRLLLGPRRRPPPRRPRVERSAPSSERDQKKKGFFPSFLACEELAHALQDHHVRRRELGVDELVGAGPAEPR